MERLTTEDLELKGCHGCEEKGICYARYWCSEKKKALIQLKRYEGVYQRGNDCDVAVCAT